MTAEDVALPGQPALGGEQVAGRDVLDVDEVDRCVEHDGEPPAQVVADDPRRCLPGLRRVDRDAEHVRRVDDDDLDAEALPRGDRLALAGALGVGVDEPEAVLGYGFSSSAGRPSAVPTAEIVEVTTTRSTSSIAAASTATSGPRWFISHTLPTGVEPTMPATWNTTSQPRIALAHRVEVEHLALDLLDVEVAEAAEALGVAVARAHRRRRAPRARA